MSEKKSTPLQPLEHQRLEVALQRERLALRREAKATQDMEACPKPGTGVKEWRAAFIASLLVIVAIEGLGFKLVNDLHREQQALEAAQQTVATSTRLLAEEKASSMKLLRLYQRGQRKLQAELAACHNANPKWGAGPR